MPGLTDEKRAYLVKAVTPSLFNAVLHPDLIVALMIANLLSPKLWELADMVRPRGRAPDGLGRRMRSLHHFVNTHFSHPSPRKFSELWGLYEREAIKDPGELASCDKALTMLRKGCEAYKDRSIGDFLGMLIENGAAPRYVYPSIDVILAFGLLQADIDGKPRPLGITSCLDECVLIASLALATGCCKMSDVVFVGSPFHYNLYLLPGDEGCMFNAKRECFSKKEWGEQSGGVPEASSRMFMEKLYACDRIITPAGYCVFPGGPSTIAPEFMRSVAKRITDFLSAEPPEISQALETACAVGAGGTAGPDGIDRLESMSRGAIEDYVIRETENGEVPLLEAALYAFRHPGVKAPELYKEAALRGFRSYIMSGLVSSPDDAWEIARGISVAESIYGQAGRLAMPDEVLLFNRADDAERHLLAETLLMHSPACPAG